MHNFVRNEIASFFMKTLFLLFGATAGLVACTASPDKTGRSPANLAGGSASRVLLQETEADSFITLHFEPFSAVISRFYTEDGIPTDTLRTDSVFIWTVYGGSLEGETVRIAGYEQLENLKVEQGYRTSLYIASEGECCELRDWKHFHAPWKPLRQIEPGLFRCIDYKMTQHEKFPAVPAAETRAAVERYCGKGWSNLLKKVQQPTDEPCDVGISNYYLRISGKKDGNAFVKIIEIGYPLCD